MKKIIVSKLFLYRYRFVIGYCVLGLAFVILLFVLPLIAQYGLSEAEITSATESFNTGREGILNGELVDLPYKLLQKVSISILGLTAYAIKFPSIIIGLILGFLFTLLLNRWFKSNVSLLVSCLIILSTPFLFLAGSGTPLIMLVFWPTLLLWLGSKIQGEKRPKPLYCFAFAIIMLLSIFTPYMIYFAIFCVIFVISQPHLRFVIRNLPKIPMTIIGLLLVVGFVILGIGIHNRPDVIMDLLFTRDFNIKDFFPNIAYALGPVFSWRSTVESVFLSPLISLPVFALVLIGLFSTTKGFFASRNSIATILIVFCLIISGFNPNAIIFLILPFSILIAHGFKYILEKWYGLFPENPYARVSAALPLVILFAIMIIPNLLQYVYGYRYNPSIANQFSYTLEVINENINSGKLLATQDYEFYKILEHKTDITVIDKLDGIHENVASLGSLENKPEEFKLSEIITSPMRENSDIIYLYTYTEKEGE